jgi:hypothetical protein
MVNKSNIVNHSNMSLGSNTVKYINIKDSKIVYKDTTGVKHYGYVQGKLTGLSTPTRVYNGKETKVWYFNMEDDKGEEYILSIGYLSGVARTILNALASTEDFSDIKITPYEKNGYTKAVVESNGTRLDWKYKDLPEVEVIRKGTEEIKDDSKRVAFFDNIGEEVKKKLSQFNIKKGDTPISPKNL